MTKPGSESAAAVEVLELVATESPWLLSFVVESLAASPARPALLELAEAMGVELSATMAKRVKAAVGQVSRLEIHVKRWREPSDVLGSQALPAAVLLRFAKARGERRRRHGRRLKPQLVRVDRLLRSAARQERAAAMVRDLLEDPPRPGKRRAAAMVRDLLAPG